MFKAATAIAFALVAVLFGSGCSTTGEEFSFANSSSTLPEPAPETAAERKDRETLTKDEIFVSVPFLDPTTCAADPEQYEEPALYEGPGVAAKRARVEKIEARRLQAALSRCMRNRAVTACDDAGIPASERAACIRMQVRILVASDCDRGGVAIDVSWTRSEQAHATREYAKDERQCINRTLSLVR